MDATQTTGISKTPKTSVARTDKNLVDGVCRGYLTYFHEYQGMPLSDRNVYTLLVNSILDVQRSDRFNAGYYTGWIEALLEVRQVLQ